MVGLVQRGQKVESKLKGKNSSSLNHPILKSTYSILYIYEGIDQYKSEVNCIEFSDTDVSVILGLIITGIARVVAVTGAAASTDTAQYFS